jgi:hypothetical protein
MGFLMEKTETKLRFLGGSDSAFRSAIRFDQARFIVAKGSA